MSEYTPSTEAVRSCYVYSTEQYDGSLATPVYIANAEFDRWLAEHDRQVAEKAWDAALAERQDLPDRDALARAIDPAIYSHVNRLTGDGWKASQRAADAVLGLLRGETR